MSILIKGMEMPKDEEMLCINIYPDGKVCINLDLECKRIANAVPVPPHGRLIDADEYVPCIIDRKDAIEAANTIESLIQEIVS